MTSIYDLDNEYGGRILTDASAKNGLEISHRGTGPALETESYTAGQPALAIYSTASARPLDVTEITFGGGGARFRSGVTYSNALTLGSVGRGNATTPPLVFANLSYASVPVIDFGNNFISTTSVQLSTEANKVIVVRAGNANYAMPLISLTSLIGAGVYV